MTITRARAVALIAAEHAEKVRPRIERMHNLLKLGMPERQALALMCTLDVTAPAIVAAERWAKRRTGLFVLAGPTGTGKSLGAACWAVKIGARWTDALEIGNLPPIGIDAAIERLARASALVIDEVGGQAATSERAAALVGAVLTRRHARCMPTVVTTNLPREDFARHMDGLAAVGSRLCDRITEDGEWMNVRGASRRSQPLPIEEAATRFAKYKRLLLLSDACDAVARGTLPTSPAIEEVVELFKITDEQLDAARQHIAEQEQKIDDHVEGLRAKWRLEEREALDS